MTECARRLARLRRRLAETGDERFYTEAAPNVRYLSGFTGSSARLLVEPDQATLYTDGRYRLQAARETADIEIIVSEPPQLPFERFLEDLDRKRVRRLAFERNRLGYAAHESLRRSSPRRALTPLEGLVESLRMVKSDLEIDAVRRSARLNDAAFEQAARRARAAWTERRFAVEINAAAGRLGAERPAFETIVAGGEHGALPHAAPRPERLVRRSLIVIDHGVILDGYASDMTRMASFGEPSREALRLVRAVEEARLAALDCVRAGVKAASVDASARKVLKKHGLAEFFPHSTGHGVGLEIHEAPRLGPGESTRLRAGMVVTIEPGAYVEGLGGARIEDLVVVQAAGCEVLSSTPRELRLL